MEKVTFVPKGVSRATDTHRGGGTDTSQQTYKEIKAIISVKFKMDT